MRRHAESLIVLAGDSPRRAFHDPVPFIDVLRAAAAEVEDYTRVKVSSRTPAALAGPAVADVIHMLAEFVENGTIFSPSNTEVRITGDLVANGFAADIEDRGQGMSDEQIAAANASLADPPLFDLSGSGQLGLFVAARLARRHGIRVTLRHSAYGGVTAIVLIPRELVITADAIGDGAEPGQPAADGGLAPATAARHAVAAESGTGPGAAGLTASAVATARYERGPVGLPSGPAGEFASQPAGEFASQPAGEAEEFPAGPAGNGLPQRVRQTSLAPQLRAGAASPAAAGEAASTRSPELARTVMSSFRQGWQRGLSDADVDAGDGPDRPPDGEGW